MNTHRSVSNLLFVIIAILGPGQLMTACGQEGDLYLPEPEQQTEAGAHRVEPAAEAEPGAVSTEQPKPQ